MYIVIVYCILFKTYIFFLAYYPNRSKTMKRENFILFFFNFIKMDSWQAIGNELLEKCIIEIKKQENMEKLHTNVMDPLIDYMLQRLYPYIMVTCIMFILMLIFLVLVFIMVFRSTGLISIPNN